MSSFSNLHLLADERAHDALRHVVDLCAALGQAMPSDEPAQAEALDRVILFTGALVRDGSLRLRSLPRPDNPIVRLYKAPAGAGRLKLQLFPLQADEAHPPHAHHDLISVQIALAGRARVREFSLLRRLEGDELEICEESDSTLAPGDGVYTLQRHNNIHWQEGLRNGTVLLNINWQGYCADPPIPADWSVDGRCYIDWSRARPSSRPGCYIVPTAEPDAPPPPFEPDGA